MGAFERFKCLSNWVSNWVFEHGGVNPSTLQHALPQLLQALPQIPCAALITATAPIPTIRNYSLLPLLSLQFAPSKKPPAI